jgi:hypothetical protein
MHVWRPALCRRRTLELLNAEPLFRHRSRLPLGPLQVHASFAPAPPRIQYPPRPRTVLRNEDLAVLLFYSIGTSSACAHSMHLPTRVPQSRLRCSTQALEPIAPPSACRSYFQIAASQPTAGLRSFNLRAAVRRSTIYILQTGYRYKVGREHNTGR